MFPNQVSGFMLSQTYLTMGTGSPGLAVTEVWVDHCQSLGEPVHEGFCTSCPGLALLLSSTSVTQSLSQLSVGLDLVM